MHESKNLPATAKLHVGTVQTSNVSHPYHGVVLRNTGLLIIDAYFGTAGKLVESYLKAPIALKSYATIELLIPTSDVRSGTGANFVADGAAAGEIAEPAVEALMAGGIGARHNAFISQGAGQAGRELKRTDLQGSGAAPLPQRQENGRR
jgi:hypothetical protein